MECSGGAIPKNAVSGGHESDGGTVYVTCALHAYETIPGKVR